MRYNAWLLFLMDNTICFSFSLSHTHKAKQSLSLSPYGRVLPSFIHRYKVSCLYHEVAYRSAHSLTIQHTIKFIDMHHTFREVICDTQSYLTILSSIM